MALLAFEAPVKVMPLLAYIAPFKVRPIPDTALLAATVLALVLSIVMVPGNTMALVPTEPGLMAAPLDLMFRLMSLVLPVVMLKLPVVMDDALVPDVVSNTTLDTAPLVLLVKFSAPV